MFRFLRVGVGDAGGEVATRLLGSTGISRFVRHNVVVVFLSRNCRFILTWQKK